MGIVACLFLWHELVVFNYGKCKHNTHDTCIKDTKGNTSLSSGILPLVKKGQGLWVIYPGWIQFFYMVRWHCWHPDCKSLCHLWIMVNSPTLWHSNLHTTMIDAKFFGFPHRVYQTCAIDVVGNGLQAFISRFNDKCVTRIVSEMTSLLVNWPFGELTCLPTTLPCYVMSSFE